MALPQHTHPITTGDGLEQTPGRLLEAAERLFAERGFGGTSVRDITAAAGCNIAAVNYHFGSKEKLYRELFATRLDDLRRQRIEAVVAVLDDAERRQDVTPVIDAFARAFVKPLTDPRRGRWVMGMFLREMTDPRLERIMLVEKLFAPVQAVMCDALRRCAKGLTERQAVMCVHSLVGQLLHAVQIERLMADEADRGPMAAMVDMEAVVAHVVTFTRAGIVGLVRDQAEAGRGGRTDRTRSKRVQRRKSRR